MAQLFPIFSEESIVNMCKLPAIHCHCVILYPRVLGLVCQYAGL